MDKFDDIAKKMTREEFLNNIECDEYGDLLDFLGKDNYYTHCPANYGMEEDCGGHCKNDCWTKAVEKVKFKGEE